MFGQAVSALLLGLCPGSPCQEPIAPRDIEIVFHVDRYFTYHDYKLLKKHLKSLDSRGVDKVKVEPLGDYFNERTTVYCPSPVGRRYKREIYTISPNQFEWDWLIEGDKYRFDNLDCRCGTSIMEQEL